MSCGEGARFALEPIFHPHQEPPETGLTFGSGGVSEDVRSWAFSLRSICDAELTADVNAGVAGMLGPGDMPVIVRPVW
jgi:hypothetical protein